MKDLEDIHKALPLVSAGFFAGTWLLGGTLTVFSNVLGAAGTPDGTRSARSGGWSLPTVGLAYKWYVNTYEN